MPARRWAASALLAVLLLVGCNPAARHPRTTPSDSSAPASTETGRGLSAEPAGGPEPSGLVHIVRWKGESLSIIAKWYTGEADNWRSLAEHNPLNDPDRIGIGDRISIPEPLLRTRAPLPRAFVMRHVQTPEKSGPPEEREPIDPAADPLPADEAPELFGPKELKSD